MSKCLFNLFMDTIAREAREKFGVKLEETTVQLLLFANNWMVVAKKDEVVERNLRMLDEVMDKWRIQVNWKKTKVMTVKQGGDSYMGHRSERGEN